MPSYTVGVAAATAVVGYDMFTGRVWAREAGPRAVRAMALTGSAVIGDSAVELYIGVTQVGEFVNSALLTPQVQRDLVPLENLYVPPGTQLRCIVTDAPATSILYVMISIRAITR